MSDRNFQQVTTDWESHLAKTQKLIVGIAQNGATCGQRVNVRLEKAIPGQPNPVPAIAWTTCHSGKAVTLFRFDGEEQWRGMGEGNTRAPNVRVVRSVHRQAKPPVAEKGGPVKILFSISRDNYETDEYFIDLYIGGDRPTPIKILTIDRNTEFMNSAHISNTGKKPGDWIVGIVLQNHQSRQVRYVILEPSGITEHVGVEYLLGYYGWGFFTSNTIFRASQAGETVTESTTNGVYGYYNYQRTRVLNGVIIENISTTSGGSGHEPRNYVQTEETTYLPDPQSLANYGVSASGYDRYRDEGFVNSDPENILELHAVRTRERRVEGNSRSFSFDKQNGLRTLEGSWFDRADYSATDDIASINAPEVQSFTTGSEDSYPGTVAISPTVTVPQVERSQETGNGSDDGTTRIAHNQSSVVYTNISAKIVGKNSAIARRYHYSQDRSTTETNGRQTFVSDFTDGPRENLILYLGEQEISITGAIPQLPLGSGIPYPNFQREANLIGNQLIVMPFDNDWYAMAQSKKSQAKIYAIAEDGSVSSTTKEFSVFPIKKTEAFHNIIGVSVFS